MRKENRNVGKRVVRACRACRGAGWFLIAGRVVTCTKCGGTGATRNK